MRRLGVLAVVLSIAAAFTVVRALIHRPRGSPLSCVLTAKSGSLTAVTSEAMLGLEWHEGSGRVGVSTANGTPSWSPRTEAVVRALAAGHRASTGAHELHHGRSGRALRGL